MEQNSNYNGLQLANVKYCEQPLPPTAVVGFNSGVGAPKDRSSVATIDPDRALVTFKEMPVPTVAPSHDAGDVAGREIGGLTVERATVINHFECRQNRALLGIVDFDWVICESCRNRLSRFRFA